MSVLLAMFSGWRWWLMVAFALSLIMAILIVRNADREAGAAKERARIEQANSKAGNAADAAERERLNCRGTWVRGEGCALDAFR